MISFRSKILIFTLDPMECINGVESVMSKSFDDTGYNNLDPSVTYTYGTRRYQVHLLGWTNTRDYAKTPFFNSIELLSENLGPI